VELCLQNDDLDLLRDLMRFLEPSEDTNTTELPAPDDEVDLFQTPRKHEIRDISAVRSLIFCLRKKKTSKFADRTTKSTTCKRSYLHVTQENFYSRSNSRRSLSIHRSCNDSYVGGCFVSENVLPLSMISRKPLHCVIRNFVFPTQHISRLTSFSMEVRASFN
jgi:hypothetical protein